MIIGEPLRIGNPALLFEFVSSQVSFITSPNLPDGIPSRHEPPTITLRLPPGSVRHLKRLRCLPPEGIMCVAPDGVAEGLTIRCFRFAELRIEVINRIDVEMLFAILGTVRSETL